MKAHGEACGPEGYRDDLRRSRQALGRALTACAARPGRHREFAVGETPKLIRQRVKLAHFAAARFRRVKEQRSDEPLAVGSDPDEKAGICGGDGRRRSRFRVRRRGRGWCFYGTFRRCCHARSLAPARLACPLLSQPPSDTVEREETRLKPRSPAREGAGLHPKEGTERMPDRIKQLCGDRLRIQNTDSSYRGVN
jgi:hypothetical protein